MTNFERQLRAYLIDATDYDICRLIEIHEQHKVVHETKVVVNHVHHPEYKICPECMKKYTQPTEATPCIEEIETNVAHYFNLDPEALHKKTRKREIVIARQTAMYFCKLYTRNSLKTIGQHFGGKDHTTVIHSIRTVKDLLETDPTFKTHIYKIQQIFETAA